MNRKIMFAIGVFSLALLTGAFFGIERLAARDGWGGGSCGGPGYGYHAGYHHGPMHWHHGYGDIETMMNELNLTDTQVKQLVDIGNKYHDKYFQNRGDYKKISDLRAEHRKAIEQVLGREQKEKLEKIDNTYGRYGWYGGCPYHF